MRKALTSWQLAMLQRQIDGLLGRLVQVPLDDPASWAPHCDILDDGDSLIVRVDIPGVRAGDVEVELDDEGLAIRGRKRPPEGRGPRHYLRTERPFGAFALDVPLPVPVARDQARATLSRGVLQVVLPRLEGERAARRRITIDHDEET